MSIPFIVATLVTLACFTVAFAAVLPRITFLKAQRDRVLARLSGVAKQAPLPQHSLRRDESPSAKNAQIAPDQQWWKVLSHIHLTPRMFILIVLGTFTITMLAWAIFGLSLLLALPMAMALTITITVIVMRRRIQKRYEAVADSIPEALEMIVRSLRVGFPVHASLLHAGERMNGPLAEELRLTAEKISFGQEISSALYAMARRTQNPDLRFFAAAVSIQMATGGNLADLLDRLATIARARQQLARKVAAITAEARWSSRFLSAFPLLAVFGLLLVNPAYFDSLQESALFYPIILSAGALMIVNIIYMRWLCQLD